jgi:hypothetical protein
MGTQSLTTNQGLSKRLIVGFVALASAAVVGAFGIANAMNPNGPDEQWCIDHGFTKNHGQCVSEWNKQKPHDNNGGGNGYGGGNGNTVETEVNVHISGNDNVFKLALNYFIGP